MTYTKAEIAAEIKSGKHVHCVDDKIYIIQWSFWIQYNESMTFYNGHDTGFQPFA